MSDTLVIIPTLQEKENIENIIRAVFKQEKQFHILIVDDNSTDGTPEIVETLMKTFEDQLFILKRKEKKGLGGAYLAGFDWALNRNYDYVIEMDADFSHNPNDLIKLYNACSSDGAAVTVGSRYLKNKISVVNWDIKRLFLSYVASKYVRLVTRIPVYDTTAGFICYHRDVLKKINLKNIRFQGYAFQIELKFKAWKHGFKIKEVPIVFTDRTKGTSKMHSSIVNEAIFGVLKMAIRGI